MKRRYLAVFVCALAMCFAVVLAGCQSKAYEPEALEPTVSTPVIGQNGELRVGVDTSSSPFAGQANGGIVGLDVDTAAALADQLGLKLKVVDVADDGVGALANGSVDIVLGVPQSTQEDGVWLSEPYLQTAVSLFAASDNGTIPTSASAPSIAAQSSSMSAWAVENIFGEAALVPCGDLTSAFSSIETGAASYVASDAVIGTYAAKTNNVDVRIIGLLENPGGYCIAVSADNEKLQKAVGDALTAVKSGGILKVIDTKWLGSDLDLSTLPLVEGAGASVASAASAEGEAANGDGMATGAAAAGSNAVLPNGSVAGA